MTEEYKKLLEEFLANGGKITKLKPVGIPRISKLAFLRKLAAADRQTKSS